MDNSLENLKHNKTSKRDIAIWVLSILLLMSIGYIIYQNINYKNHSTALTIDANDIERSREILKQELRVLRSDYEDVKKVAKKQDSTINERDLVIFEKQKQIQSILNHKEISEGELNRARVLIISLQDDINDYKKQIAKLIYENKALNASNLALNLQKDSIIVEKQTVEKNLKNSQENFDKHQESVNSTLSLSNYSIKGLSVKNSGKEVETTRAKRIDKVRVTFDLDNNNVASGKKTLYIAIHKPDGSLGIFKDAEFGDLKLRNGNEVKYSDVMLVNYVSGEAQTVSFDWVDYDFPKGKYEIDVYENGFKIGQSSIELK
ncbi:coiled-coil domain-containing protein [Vaginella massiliensis]|uniref:hypothetical protein n=1 Tax=Vaginella massiliensis TaxID=1816680 RepID=UPI0008381F12|nr:hypothetical protein [Vaginella massiliensis]